MMRLIDAQSLVTSGTINLQMFSEWNTPEYVILSHRWGSEEVELSDFSDIHTFWNKQTNQKEGYRKIQSAAAVTVDYRYSWLWCDTCCIDKTSSAELSEAINSMYRWYKDSSLCLAYLADYPTPKVPVFTQSEWFERAWTLQELIAPAKLVFFDKAWKTMPNKHDLAESIALRTRIDKQALSGERRLERYTVAQRMSWAADRKATRTEDIAYSLLGIFDVNMPMLYGEGKKAFLRLQEEIIQRNADQSIFVWSSSVATRSLFASTPADFMGSIDVLHRRRKQKPFFVNNMGFDIELPLRPAGLNTYLAELPLEDGLSNCGVGLFLEIDPDTGFLCRIGSTSGRVQKRRTLPNCCKTRKVTISRQASDKPPLYAGALFGFRLAETCLPLTCINDWDPQSEYDCGQWVFAQPAPHPSVLHRNPSFHIPTDVPISIAMLSLQMAKESFLIQLTFDFDFNPCCHVSRMTSSMRERFTNRKAFTTDEDWPIKWPENKSLWTANLRYEDTSFDEQIDNRAVGQRCWVAKSIDQQEFTATIPTAVTKPYYDIKASFFWSAQETEWRFAVTTERFAEDVVPLQGNSHHIVFEKINTN